MTKWMIKKKYVEQKISKYEEKYERKLRIIIVCVCVFGARVLAFCINSAFVTRRKPNNNIFSLFEIEYAISEFHGLGHSHGKRPE